MRAGRGRYSIDTPASFARSHLRPGNGGSMRVRTMRIGSPQHGQRSAARGFTQAVMAAGTIFINTTCNSAIRVRFKLM